MTEPGAILAICSNSILNTLAGVVHQVNGGPDKRVRVCGDFLYLNALTNGTGM